MQEFIPWNTLTFQFTNLYDRNNLEFTERVTQHLRESIYILNDEKLNGIESVILGDIIPERYFSQKSNWFIYQMDQYQDVEDIILQLNQDIFCEDLTGISDPDIDIVVKFVYALNIKN